ncbi:SprT family zinc-dependent metalloprotease [Synechococcus sp. CS-1328]|uniref:SprT family zinc-dependent metalloprotease n=1 Tax=Synechococcus sp. CS-1328 TaxID=2847976 RepID=UPI00223B9F08|nr:SprT family zinc-dependent metalloprotease [Synechococcus sp. CS-1328]MCT0223722.1 SprT family zinc-dependent metalloprotease [Synechococcus sp. CS-1328]
MTLEPLLPLFHRLDREHFDGSLAPGGQPLVTLRWSDGRLSRTAGLYRRGRRADGSDLCEIVLSRPLLEPLPRQATLGTLCHEMIHAWVDRILDLREVHGPHFRARMATINARQHDFVVSLRHSFPVPTTATRWIAHCPHCGLQARYQRRRRNLACRQCCERWHNGLWHASCVLVFKPAQVPVGPAEQGL